MPLYRKKKPGAKHYFGQLSRLSNRGLPAVVKPGDIIECEAWELGAAVDLFEIVEETVNPPAADDAPLPLEPRHIGGGWYNLIGPNGKRVNAQPLRKAEAYRIADGSQTGDGGEQVEPATAESSASS